MRLSRKAGLLACVVKWIKYEAYRIYSYTVSDWIHEETEPVEDGVTIAGYNGYIVSPHGEPGDDYAYEQGSFSMSAPYKRITAPDTGTVYAGANSRLSRVSLVAADDGGTIRDIYTKTITNTFLGYEKGDEIGYVYAADGKYPDENKGYTYVTTDSGYIIMRDGDGNYYAYELAPRPAPAEFTAKIEDDVLVVRGNGVATIENGILYVR